MKNEARTILLKYWGHASFRPMQEEIVLSVLEGNDTLALLPTGGGKSVCFQVPALMRPGLCLVITPLIALMKDQVQHLRKIGIAASAIYSGMHTNEVEITYNQAVFDRLKFLYISPERLQTEKFIEAVKRMKVNLIAVDESHCISQWGYDFRPPYLQIALIRPFLPCVPVLALTATATPQVVDDIQQKLLFKKKNIFQTSYERKNLTYNVIHETDKYGTLIRLLQKITSGCAIVYVRNRRRTVDLAGHLHRNGISATYYHAGLDARQRDENQKLWMTGRAKVVAATNAFGMGIDKPDVRIVIHFDLPDSIEAYFQEAGRAGRDGKDAQAFLLVSDQDIGQLKLNFETSFPEIPVIRDIYQALGNYFQVPVGSGRDVPYDFDMVHFAKTYSFQPLEVFHALKLLEKDGLLVLSEGMNAPTRVFITARREDLYRLQVEQPSIDPLIKLLLRNFPGIMTDFVAVNEEDVARKMGSTVERIQDSLNQLVKLNILYYDPRKDKPQLTFTSERRKKEDVVLSQENYHQRKMTTLERVQAVINFVSDDERCRNIQLLAYFGEKMKIRCGKCDVCLKRNKITLTDIEYETIREAVQSCLQQRPHPVYELVHEIDFYSDEKILEAIRWMLDNKLLQKDENDNLKWRTQLEI
jgi:ATP-dependent DNA helicase RecQ